MLENIWVNISGRLVPTDNTVSPINARDRLRDFAILTALSTTKFAPNQIATSPSIKLTIAQATI